jgi:hypothetical protein
MIEAAMIWNEPNNKSHWDPEIDPEWSLFAEHVAANGEAIRRVNPAMTRVLGGMSPIDPHWLRRMERNGALDHVDVVAVHGFPLDWNLWPLKAWPDKIAEIQAVTDKPIWVTEVGVSSFGAEEVQLFGGVPMNLELRLSVEVSSNSAGVAIDLIRCARLAKDRGLAGPVHAPASAFCKHPPPQVLDDQAFVELEQFIRG